LTKNSINGNLSTTVPHTLRTRKRNRGPGGVIFLFGFGRTIYEAYIWGWKYWVFPFSSCDNCRTR